MIIACTIDNNYIRHCAALLASLHAANPREDISVYIIHNQLDPAQRASLAAYLGSFLSAVSFIQLDPSLLEGFPVYGHITIATYFRLLLPAVLPAGVERVIFMDCDMIVLGNLRELWETPLDDRQVGAVIDRSQDENGRRLGLSEGSRYFNAGVLLIDLEKWRQNDILSKGLLFATTNQDKIRFWDQDVLNYLLEGDWLPIHPRWNSLPHLWGLTPEHEVAGTSLTALDRDAQANPAVVHFAGPGVSKPWNFHCTHPYKDRYLHFLAQTPWADTPLDDQPPPAIRRWWDQSIFRAKCALRKGFRSLGFSA